MEVWEVEVTDQFLEWWRQLPTEQQAALDARVELLAGRDPSLGRPAVERIQSSRHHNMRSCERRRVGRFERCSCSTPGVR